MIATAITAPQLKRLQVLYGQYQRRSLDTGESRLDRLAWASDRTGRKIESFSELTLDEGRLLIDGIQRALGLASTTASSRPTTRRDAEKAGTEGRHDQIHPETTLVGDADLRRVRREMSRLGMDEARLEAFLASKRGPLSGRTQVRTLGDANKVYWALKRMKTPTIQAKGAQPIAN